MSFELSPVETFAENVTRLARQRLDRVLAALPDGGDSPAGDAVHTARQDLKKLRALLRLARAGLGEETFARENADARDAGRILSAVRDAQVLVEVFEALRAEMAGRAAPETVEAIHRQLLDDAQATGATLHSQGQYPAAAGMLRGMRERLSAWPTPRQDGWQVPGRGLKAVYREGRRAMQRAASAPEESDFHEWRKQVKYLAAHVRLLRPLRPKKLKKLGNALGRLADSLGREHDLSVLKGRLTEHPETWASPHELGVIGSVIDEHRAALQAEAMELGRVLYRDKPARVARRFKRDWQVWRDGK